MSFSLSSQSALFRWLGGRGGDEPAPALAETEGEEEEDLLDDPAGAGDLDLGDAAVVQGFGDETRRDRSRGRPRQGGVGRWNASLSYSLARSRDASADASQMLQGSLRFQPTDKWSVNWRTSYDVEARAFNDHVVSLQRDLHRWDADFSFRQTATGNWSFLFEVSLSDNRDLHFDYEQRTEVRR